jgi:glutathione S-transferase
MYLWPSLVSVLALVLFFVLGGIVGWARGKYKVPAPQTSGHPTFERMMRVQQNTLEQLILFLPALWLFAMYMSPVWAGRIGLLWVLGRIVYAWGYYTAAEKRGPGFGISALSMLTLLLGSLVGIIRGFLA